MSDEPLDEPRLLLDKRWTLKERWRYTKAIEYGEFHIATEILFARLTPEERAERIRKARELLAEWQERDIMPS